VPEPPAPPTVATETLLVVENESAIRSLVQVALERHGYRVLSAESGEEALRVDAGHDGAIDLLITDVFMADLRGPELAKQLLKLRPGLAVLFMSGYTDEALDGHGMQQETKIDFIQKPFSPRALAAKVRDMLDRPRRAAVGPP
jgi:two-component system cell cycle sensor histidine kinase/response regulator CckA